MRKILTVALLTVIMCITLITPAFADRIKTVNCENLPTVNAVVEVTDNNIAKDNITATLDGKVLSVDNITASEGKTEWLIMVDTSQSVRKDYFNAAITSIKALYNSLGENDTMKLYCFDEKIEQILNGTETKEEAVKKIDAIKCDGMETVFYDAIKQITDLSEKSTADSCVSVFFTDGVDTISATTADEAKTALTSSKSPVYGFYSDVTKSSDAEKLNTLLSASKGSAVAYSLTNLTAKLTSIEGRNYINIQFTAPADITPNTEAVLIIDLGDGNKLTQNIDTSSYKEPVTEEEPTTSGGDTTGKIESITPVLAIIAVLVIVIIIALIVIRKKTSGKPTEPKDNTDDLKATQKEAEKQAKLEEKEKEKQAKEAEAEAKKNAKKNNIVFTVGKDTTTASGRNKADEMAKKYAEQKARDEKKAEKAAERQQAKEDKKAEKEIQAEQKKKNNTVVFTVAAPSKNTKIKKNDKKIADEIAQKREKQKQAEEKKAQKDAAKEQKKAAAKAKKTEQEKIKRSQSNQYQFYFNDKK